MNRREELAYLAGVLDSDGSICIRRAQRRRRLGLRPWADYAVVMAVSQMKKPALELFNKHFGGPISRERSRLYHWQITHRMAHKAILALRPWMRVKATQAWLALEYRAQRGAYPRQALEGRGGSGLGPEGIALREGYAEAMRIANKEAL